MVNSELENFTNLILKLYLGIPDNQLTRGLGDSIQKYPGPGGGASGGAMPLTNRGV